jgi:hypothetical protein
VIDYRIYWGFEVVDAKGGKAAALTNLVDAGPNLFANITVSWPATTAPASSAVYAAAVSWDGLHESAASNIVRIVGP